MTWTTIKGLPELQREIDQMMKSEYKVLKKPIPFGGKGRNLTSSECKALRGLGVSCSESYMVNRLQDLDYRGALYRPAENGYSSVGITVEMSD